MEKIMDILNGNKILTKTDIKYIIYLLKEIKHYNLNDIVESEKIDNIMAYNPNSEILYYSRSRLNRNIINNYMVYNNVNINLNKFVNMNIMRYILHEFRHIEQNTIETGVLKKLYDVCFYRTEEIGDKEKFIRLLTSYKSYIKYYSMYLTEVNADLVSLCEIYELCLNSNEFELCEYFEKRFREKINFCYDENYNSIIQEFLSNSITENDIEEINKLSDYELLINGLNLRDISLIDSDIRSVNKLKKVYK